MADATNSRNCLNGLDGKACVCGPEDGYDSCDEYGYAERKQKEDTPYTHICTTLDAKTNLYRLFLEGAHHDTPLEDAHTLLVVGEGGSGKSHALREYLKRTDFHTPVVLYEQGETPQLICNPAYMYGQGLKHIYHRTYFNTFEDVLKKEYGSNVVVVKFV